MLWRVFIASILFCAAIDYAQRAFTQQECRSIVWAIVYAVAAVSILLRFRLCGSSELRTSGSPA